MSREDGRYPSRFLLFPAVSLLRLLAKKEMKEGSVSKGREVATNKTEEDFTLNKTAAVVLLVETTQSAKSR